MAATSFAYWYGRQYFSSQRAYQENPVKLKIKENKDYPSLWIQGIQGEWDNYKRYNIHVIGITEGKKIRNWRNIWNNDDWEVPQINVRHQTMDSGNSENQAV